MRLRIATSTALIIGLLAIPIVHAEQNGNSPEAKTFPDVLPVIRNGIETAITATANGVIHVFTGKDRKTSGWKEVHVPGKSLKECLGPDKNLNEEVLRCRNGYNQRVPIHSN